MDHDVDRGGGADRERRAGPSIDPPRVAFLTTMIAIAALIAIVLIAYLLSPAQTGTGCGPGSTLVTSPNVRCVPAASTAAP